MRSAGSKAGRKAEADRRSEAPASACLERALRLLARRDHAEAELRRKLGQAGCAPEDVETAVARLTARGYLDDARFAENRARSLASEGRLGRRAIAVRLRQAGVSESLVEQALGVEEVAGRSESRLAEALLKKRFPELGADSAPRDKARAARFLSGRGFSSEVVFRLLRFEEGAF